MIRVHLAPSDLDPILFPDNSAENVQGRMGTHHLVTKFPVNAAHNLCTYCWRRTIYGVPNYVVSLVHSYNVGLLMLVIPTDYPTVRHLPAPSRVEDSGVKCYLIPFNRYNRRCALVGKAIGMIE